MIAPCSRGGSFPHDVSCTPAAGGALTASHPVTAAPGQVGQCAKFRHRPATAAPADLSLLPGQRWWALSGLGATWGPGSAMLACAPSCPCSSLSCCLALSLVPACLFLDATAGHRAAVLGPAPLVLGSSGGGCMGCEGPGLWLLCLRVVIAGLVCGHVQELCWLSPLLPPWALLVMLKGVCQPRRRRHHALSSGQCPAD